MNPFIDVQQNLEIETGEIGISWTGQAGFAFKDSTGLVYHIDPYLSDICSRTIGYQRIAPTPVKAEDVIADFILITHTHHDHLDDESIPVIAKINPELSFIGPPSCISFLLELGISPHKLISIGRNQKKRIGNLLVKAVLACHTNDSVGYVLYFENLICYVTGDTTYSDDLIPIKEEKPQIVMTCINGRLGCMNIPDTARLMGHIQPQFAVPMHYGMFKENTADPREFVRQVEAYSGITKGFIMEQGNWYVFNKEQGFFLEG